VRGDDQKVKKRAKENPVDDRGKMARGRLQMALTLLIGKMRGGMKPL
jgi:hypothetical protein